MYNINLIWDEESKVWIATSEELKGLVLEGKTIDALVERVCLAATELLPMNNQKSGGLNFTIKQIYKICMKKSIVW